MILMGKILITITMMMMLVRLLTREDNYDFDEKILIRITMMMMLVRLLGTAEHRGGV